MAVDWQRCKGDVWCGFDRLDLATVGNVGGVYIIWKSGLMWSEVVYVGQGEIANRIAAHRSDRRIRTHGPEYVTWATVPRSLWDGMERYLYRVCRPLVAERAPPDVPEVVVNLPAWNPPLR